MLVFEEKGKPEYPEKNLSEQREPTANSTHIWCQCQDLNLSHIFWEANILTTALPLCAFACTESVAEVICVI